VEVEPEASVGIDVAVDHRRDASPVVRVETAAPSGFGQYLLDHEGVDIDKRQLNQMKTEHPDLLIVGPVGGHLTALAEEDEVVDVVPVFGDVQAFVDLPAQLQ
jgi:hypothetical protein